MDKAQLETLKTRALALWKRHGRETPVPGLFVASADVPTGPIHGVYRPSVCIVLQGTKISQLGGQAYRYEEGNCLITSLEVPIRAHILDASAHAPYVAFVLDIEPAVVSELLVELARGEPIALPR